MGDIITRIATNTDPSFLGGAIGTPTSTGACNQKLGCGSPTPTTSDPGPIKYSPIEYSSPEPTPVAQPEPEPAPTYVNPIGAPVSDPSLPLTSSSPASSVIELISSPVNALTDSIGGVLGSILGFGTPEAAMGGAFAPTQAGNFGDFQSYDQQANRGSNGGGNSFLPIIIVVGVGIAAYLAYQKWG